MAAQFHTVLRFWRKNAVSVTTNIISQQICTETSLKHQPGKTLSKYQASTAYSMASSPIMMMEVRKENSSPSNRLVWMLSHCRPRPCSSYRERYSVPKPKATWESKLW